MVKQHTEYNYTYILYVLISLVLKCVECALTDSLLLDICAHTLTKLCIFVTL